MRTPESFEKKEIDTYLEAIGAYVEKRTTMGYGASGSPDRTACIDGQFWGIEVKRDDAIDPSKLQQRRMEAIRDAGGMAVCGTASKVVGTINLWRQIQTSDTHIARKQNS